MYRAFRAVIKRHLLIQDGDSVLCGVSGGLDSMALVSLLVLLKKDIPFDLSLAHVNYGLRGKESDDQEKLVRDFAVKNNLKCFVTKGAGTTQSETRDFRYHYFAEVAGGVGANKAAVAHHLEDQVETILGHLLRGSSLRGLGGMRDASALFVTPVKAGVQSRLDPGFRRDDVRLIRPLLGFSKESLKHYASQNNIFYIDDSSNASPKYFRNRLRQELLPVIQNLKPQSFGKIIRLGEELRELSGYLEGEAKEWLSTHLLARGEPALAKVRGSVLTLHPDNPHAKKEGEAFWMPRPALVALPRLLRLEILRWAFFLWNGNALGLKKDHLQRCDQICLRAKKEGSYPLSQGALFLRQGDDLLLRKVS